MVVHSIFGQVEHFGNGKRVVDFHRFGKPSIALS